MLSCLFVLPERVSMKTRLPLIAVVLVLAHVFGPRGPLAGQSETPPPIIEAIQPREPNHEPTLYLHVWKPQQYAQSQASVKRVQTRKVHPSREIRISLGGHTYFGEEVLAGTIELCGKDFIGHLKWKSGNGRSSFEGRMPLETAIVPENHGGGYPSSFCNVCFVLSTNVDGSRFLNSVPGKR